MPVLVRPRQIRSTLCSLEKPLPRKLLITLFATPHLAETYSWAKGQQYERNSCPFENFLNYLRPIDRILCTQTVPDPVRRNIQCKLNGFQLCICNCPIFQIHCSAWLQLQHKHHLVAFLALQSANFRLIFWLITFVCWSLELFKDFQNHIFLSENVPD